MVDRDLAPREQMFVRALKVGRVQNTSLPHDASGSTVCPEA